MLGPRGWEEAWGWQEWLAGVIQGLEDYDWGMRWKLAPHGFVRLLWLVPFPLLMPSCEISSIALGRALVFGTLVTPWCHSTTTPFSCCSLCWPPSPAHHHLLLGQWCGLTSGAEGWEVLQVVLLGLLQGRCLQCLHGGLHEDVKGSSHSRSMPVCWIHAYVITQLEQFQRNEVSIPLSLSNFF